MNLGDKLITSCITIFSLLLASCTGELPVKNEIVVHELSDPEMINPCNTTEATTYPDGL